MSIKVKNTYVINLLGGSGLGKSTTAALLFGALKQQGELVELVSEFVKEWAWEGRAVGPLGQSVLYGNQLERELRLYNKVDFIVTDSPLLLCPVYQQHYTSREDIKQLVFEDLQIAKKHYDVVHLNFLLKRKKPFDPRGRYEDESTAKVIDGKIEDFLINHNLDYTVVDCSDADRVNFILNKIKELKRGS